MNCPGHPDTPAGTIWHSQCPKDCVADGYPPLPGDPGWPEPDPVDPE